MAIETRRIRKPGKPGRTYRGEEEARFLVDVLNGGRMDPQIDSDCLRRIIPALRKLDECQPMNKPWFVSRGSTKKGLGFKMKAVNTLLQRYEARPVLFLPVSIRSGMRLGWRRGGAEDLELQAVLIAVRFALEGRIAALKECANSACKRWLFARFKHQKFCSDACKELFHRTDEADKERRKKWAKDNYKSRKELELGSRKAAQTRGGKK